MCHPPVDDPLKLLALAFVSILSCGPLTAAKDLQLDAAHSAILKFNNTFQADQPKVAAS